MRTSKEMDCAEQGGRVNSTGEEGGNREGVRKQGVHYGPLQGLGLL